MRVAARPSGPSSITGLALFMASLDNLVVSSALPVIRVRLHAGLSGLEWTVNAYTLTFAVLLLAAAAVGDRFGRRRVFLVGIGIFTVSSAVAALAPSIGVLVAARALQGAGGAMIMPLSLTLLSTRRPPERRNAALGLWGAIGGTAVALGPLVGGAVTTGLVVAVHLLAQRAGGRGAHPARPVAAAGVEGQPKPLDPVGIGLVSVGLFGIVLALVRGNAHGWTSPSVVGSFAVGCLALAGFVAWELRSDHPMLDLRLFRRRGFTAVNVTALLFSFGMFGAIFFLIQFLQTVQGYSPLASGIRILPWTAMPMVLAPAIGVLAERRGGKPLVVTGLALQAIGLAWLISLIQPDHPLRRHGRPLRRLRHRACRCSSCHWPDWRSGPSRRRSKAWPRGPTAPSASWAACSASPCSVPSSAPMAATAPPRTTWPG